MELHPKYDSDIETDDPIYTCQECVKRFMIHVIRLSGPRMVTLISVSVCAQLCPVLCNTLDCSPDSSVHGIFQASILERVAISSSRGSSCPRDQTCVSCVSCIAGRLFTVWFTRTKPILKLNLTIIQRSKNNSIDLDSLLLCIISGDMEIPQQLLFFLWKSICKISSFRNVCYIATVLNMWKYGLPLWTSG